jgi:hypothetical protein
VPQGTQRTAYGHAGGISIRSEGVISALMISYSASGCVMAMNLKRLVFPGSVAYALREFFDGIRS